VLVWAMGIIATEKANLRTELAVAVNRVREQELRFYSTSLNVIGTEATLLVGLAFAMIAGWEPILPYEGYLPLNWSTAIGITNRHDYIGEGGIPHWDWSDYLTQILQVAYLCVSMYTTIRLLSIVQMCVFSEFRGVGLALRGPDGSLQSAVHKLQRQVEFQAMGIRRALWSLGIAIFLLVVVRLPWIVGIPTCLASMPWAYRALKRDTFIDETFKLETKHDTKVTWIDENAHDHDHSGVRLRRKSTLLEKSTHVKKRQALFGRIPGFTRRRSKPPTSSKSQCWLAEDSSAEDPVNDKSNTDAIISTETTTEVEALIHTQQNKLLPAEEKAITRIQALQRGKSARRTTRNLLLRQKTASFGLGASPQTHDASTTSSTRAGEPGPSFMGKVGLMLFPAHSPMSPQYSAASCASTRQQEHPRPSEPISSLRRPPLQVDVPGTADAAGSSNDASDTWSARGFLPPREDMPLEKCLLGMFPRDM